MAPCQTVWCPREEKTTRELHARLHFRARKEQKNDVVCDFPSGSTVKREAISVQVDPNAHMCVSVFALFVRWQDAAASCDGEERKIWQFLRA